MQVQRQQAHDNSNELINYERGTDIEGGRTERRDEIDTWRERERERDP